METDQNKIVARDFLENEGLVPTTQGIYTFWAKINDLVNFSLMWERRRRLYGEAKIQLKKNNEESEGSIPELKAINTEKITIKEGYVLLYIGQISDSLGLKSRIKSHLNGAMKTGGMKLLGTNPNVNDSSSDERKKIIKDLSDQDFMVLSPENIVIYWRSTSKEDERKDIEKSLQNKFYPILGKLEDVNAEQNDLTTFELSLNLKEPGDATV